MCNQNHIFLMNVLEIRQHELYLQIKKETLHMKQADYIKQIARFALANDNARLLDLLYRYVEYSQQNNRGKFASEILSIIKDTDRRNTLGKLREFRLNKEIESKADEFIIQTVMSSFTMKDLVCTPNIQEELEYFIKERKQVETLAKMDISCFK